MKRYIKASYQNFPSWLVEALDNPANKYNRNKLGSSTIDLHNAEFQEVSSISNRDPRLTDPDYKLVIKFPTSVVSNNDGLYIPGFIGDDVTIYDDNYRNKGRMKDQSRKWMIDNAEHIGFIYMPHSRKAPKTRYKDPRYSTDRWGNAHYEGQRRSDGAWWKPYNRDKSGYAIPDPRDLINRLYDINKDNYAQVLDRYYEKVMRLKDRITSIDFRGEAPDVADSNVMYSYSDHSREISRAWRYFGEVIESYNALCHAVNVAVRATAEHAADEGMSEEEYFDDYVEYDINRAKTELATNIQYVQEALRKLNA